MSGCEAYHVIGISNTQHNNLLSKKCDIQDHDSLMHQLTNIINSGCLLSSHYTNILNCSMSLDRYAGDDHYIFLSLDTKYLEAYNEYAYGLVFDAKQLVMELDAVIGKEDLIFYYDKALFQVLDSIILKDSIIEYKPPNGLLHSKIRDLPLEKQYLYYAILSCNNTAPGVIEFKHEFTRLASAIHKQYRVSGEDALDYLNKWLASPQDYRYAPEVLVSDKLLINYAIGKIVKGKIDYQL